MADAASRELEAAGIEQKPGTLLADAGYSNVPQIERVRERGTEFLVATDRAAQRTTPVRLVAKSPRSGRWRLKSPADKPLQNLVAGLAFEDLFRHCPA